MHARNSAFELVIRFHIESNRQAVDNHALVLSTDFQDIEWLRHFGLWLI